MKTTIRIVYQTVRGAWHECPVEESEAQARMDYLRSLPDVKAETVRMSM